MTDPGSSATAAGRPSVAGWVLLVPRAESARAYVGGAFFAASLVLLYTTSATYHRVTWSERLRPLMKRLDHSMIFVVIAGAEPPFCLVVGGAWGISMLSVIWGL